MVEVDMFLEGFLKPLGFVKTFAERKIVCMQEMKSFLMNLSREKEILLTMGKKQRLLIESLLWRVKKLEEATRFSSNGDEIPSMKSGTLVDENPFNRNGKIIKENSSKKDIKENIGVKKARTK